MEMDAEINHKKQLIGAPPGNYLNISKDINI
jgi:hypothetical protein